MLHPHKKDLKDVYRQVHTRAHIVVACKILVKYFVLLLLRFLFGSRPAPGDFFLISKMIVDLSNNLLSESLWTASDFVIPYCNMSPPHSRPAPLTKPLIVLLLDVLVPYRPEGGSKGYVEGMWTVVLHHNESTSKPYIALDIAIKSTFCPLAKDKLIHCLDPISLVKIQAEGKL